MTANGGEFLTETLLKWDGVTTCPHRFGGMEFQVNGKEIGHLHGKRLFDLLSTKSERGRWIQEGKASPHHIYPDSNWVSVYLDSEQDTAHAVEIARHIYKRIQERQKIKTEGVIRDE